MNKSDPSEPTAVVREIGGQQVLVDPDGAALMRAVSKRNCQNTFEAKAERIAYYKRSSEERGLDAMVAVIVVINVDDQHGGPIAEILMPAFDWQAIRDRGEVPFALGLAARRGIYEAVRDFDEEAAAKMLTMKQLAVVVVDHGVAEVFPAE